MDPLAAKASKNAGDIVRLAIKHDAARKALIVYDTRTPLSKILTAAYTDVLPGATALDFDQSSPTDVLAAIAALSPGDLVILIQSSDFRLAEFRIRIELFQRGLAVIEHVHLERSTDEAQVATYVDALAYDPDYYLPRARYLKQKIDSAKTIVVRCADTALTYEGGMEAAKLNVGDYTDMKNIGGTFPIGEVFSEPRDFSKVNGEAMIFAFAGVDHLVQIHRPFRVRIDSGILSAPDAPAEFLQVLDQIRAEEAVLVREFGIGLNAAMGKGRVLKDITAFERQRGLHLSLGEKHGVYKKPGFNPKKTHFHIDVFVDVERIEVDGEALAY
jgi:aminopeptidase